MVTVTFFLTAKQLPVYSGAAIEGVLVRVYNEAGDTFITQGTTDENGELNLDLPDMTTYWVRFFKETYAFDTRLTIDVDSGAASNTFDIEGQYLIDLPPSGNAYLCRASGYVRGADWAPRSGVTFRFTLTGKPRVVANQVMVVSDVIVESDEDGWIEVELVRNGTYDCWIEGLEDQTIRVQVPDQDAVSITDLVWPYVVAFTFGASSLALAEEDTATLAAYVTLSSGVTTPFEMDDGDVFPARYFVKFTVADENIIDITWDTDDNLVITGGQAGSTTISVSVNPDLEVIREPEPVRSLGTLPVTVTV
jgi:hypothetical protein